MVRKRKPDPVGDASLTYKGAGVDIDAAEDMVAQIRPLVRRTFGPRVMGSFGGFAGMFRLDYNERLFKRNYADPVIVACTDGVGTKLKVAFLCEKLDTVGIDLVAMSVNDLICCGAEPLLFLDYLALGRLEVDKVEQIVRGISDGCLQAGCALLGGETAEMPDFYADGEFDMAGFAVGVVERRKVIDGSNMEPGDSVIALASDGLHANGFGLARKVLLQRAGYHVDDAPAELEGASIGQAMLAPTRIYAKAVLNILGRYKVKRVVKAMAHVTGGGLAGNLPRVLPKGMAARIRRGSWQVPAIFKLIQKKGPVDETEMYRVFNMGVGLVMVVAPTFAKSIMAQLRRNGERCWELGKIKKGGPDIEWA